MQFHPSYRLVRASPLPLEVGYLFLVGSNILLLMVVQFWSSHRRWQHVHLLCHLVDSRSNKSILKEISPEYSLEGLMLKLKLQYFGLPDAKNQLIRKDPDAGKDWRQDERGMTEDWDSWHHWLNGHEFEQALGLGDGQESLACCSPWGCKESDRTEWLNWTDMDLHLI